MLPSSSAGSTTLRTSSALYSSPASLSSSDDFEIGSKQYPADGRIHGGLVHIGTPHSRAKHLQPNLAQVPSNKKGAPYAAECRALFRHPGELVFVTCDQANLQDRAFAHHLAEYDGRAYAQAFLAGADQHWQTRSRSGSSRSVPSATKAAACIRRSARAPKLSDTDSCSAPAPRAAARSSPRRCGPCSARSDLHRADRRQAGPRSIHCGNAGLAALTEHAGSPSRPAAMAART